VVGTRGAAIGLAVGGIAVVLGSLMTWGTCPDTTCGAGGLAFFVLVPKSGIDFGLGYLTLGAGLVVTLVGLETLRLRGASRFARGPLPSP